MTSINIAPSRGRVRSSSSSGVTAARRPVWVLGTSPGEAVLEFVTGDITHEVSDAIVNPAGGGLVDLAIRRGAGPQLLEAFHAGALELPGRKLSPGGALVTPGFGLLAGRVIHCGPPIYADDPVRARKDLAACYVAALRWVRGLGARSVSFPAIATGVYRFPLREATEIALETVVAELRAHAGGPRLIRFVLFDAAMVDLYVQAGDVILGEDSKRSGRGAAFEIVARK